MRIAFMGTPEFAVPTLVAVLEAGHEVAAVYTQPPRPAGRGMRERLSPVHRQAMDAGLPVFAPVSLKQASEQHAFDALHLDVAVVVAYGLLLPRPILEMPRHGCFNLHASALPRWRGAAPIQRTIMAGDAETAAAIMRMDAGLDTGPVCLQQRVGIGPDMTAGELADLLAARGAGLMLEVLTALQAGRLVCWPQSAEGDLRKQDRQGRSAHRFHATGTGRPQPDQGIVASAGGVVGDANCSAGRAHQGLARASG